MKYIVNKFVPIQPGLIRVYLQVYEVNANLGVVDVEVVIPIKDIFDIVPITDDGKYVQGLIMLGKLDKAIKEKIHELRYTVFHACSLNKQIEVINELCSKSETSVVSD